MTQGSDIWSLGCVFSVAATYVVLGKEGVKQYRLLRSKAIERLGLGIGDPFHNQEVVLPEVLHWHKYLREVLRKHDCYTARVLDLIDQRMLIVPGESRIPGHELPQKLSEILQSTEDISQSIPASITEFLSQISSFDQHTISQLEDDSQDISQSGTEPLFLEPILFSSRRSEGRTPSFKTHGSEPARKFNFSSESNATPRHQASSSSFPAIPKPESSTGKQFSELNIPAEIAELPQSPGLVGSPLHLKYEMKKHRKSMTGWWKTLTGQAPWGDPDPLGAYFENRDVVSSLATFSEII